MMTFAYQSPSEYALLTNRGFVWDNKIDALLKDTGYGPLQVNLDRFDALDIDAQLAALNHAAQHLVHLPWRIHSAQFAKGETPPVTIESLQAAWQRDQEVMDDQRKEIAALKQTVNQLRQAAEKKHETVRRMAANIAEYMALVDKMKTLMQTVHAAEKQMAAARRGGRL